MGKCLAVGCSLSHRPVSVSSGSDEHQRGLSTCGLLFKHWCDDDRCTWTSPEMNSARFQTSRCFVPSSKQNRLWSHLRAKPRPDADPDLSFAPTKAVFMWCWELSKPTPQDQVCCMTVVCALFWFPSQTTHTSLWLLSTFLSFRTPAMVFMERSPWQRCETL